MARPPRVAEKLPRVSRDPAKRGALLGKLLDKVLVDYLLGNREGLTAAVLEVVRKRVADLEKRHGVYRPEDAPKPGRPPGVQRAYERYLNRTRPSVLRHMPNTMETRT